MLGWIPELKEERALRVLCLGAHSDDIEIGCGGTMLELIRRRPSLDVHWVVFSGTRTRAAEARASADYWLDGVGHRQVRLHDFRDGFFPDQWAQIKEEFEQIKEEFSPDLIFSHCEGDRHQDHRIIHELTWNTFRNHAVLGYEIPKFDGDLNPPHSYVPLAEETARAKSAALMNYFNSQGTKHWFCEELFLGLMRLRGIESCSPSGYAEGFHVRKMVMGF